MANKQRLGWLFVLLITLVPAGIAFQNWERVAPTETARALSAALPHPTDAGKTLLASVDQIFEARAGSKDWKKITPPRTGIRILRLYHFPQFAQKVFVLADRGLFELDLNHPGSWHPLRESRRGENFTAFAVSPADSRHWFLGSTFHFYESRDAGKTWRVSSALSEDPVCFLKFSADRFYAASDKTLYVSDDLSYFQKTLSLFHAENDSIPEDIPEIEEAESAEASCPFYDIFSSPDLPFLWAATHRGVFQSRDGETWKALSQSGLASTDMRHLTYSQGTQELFAGTPEGIYAFRLRENRWQNIYQASGGEEIKGLLIDNAQNKLYGITTRGFISHPLLPDHIAWPAELNPENKMLFQQLIRLEPTAREIHQAVIRYANARNGKINRWQAESRLRALLPSVSFKKDFSRDNNIDLDRGSTSERDLFIEGPADISQGWDLNVSWDLGDFIFNTSQTSIDSREKNMVELRHDLTQEATRLYYERRRLQMEAALIPAASEQEHFDRLLRVEELTAMLDGLTNGFMAKRLEEIYRLHPELQPLWEAAHLQEEQ